MKLMHLADLHLGKRVNGFSMLEDQEYILKSILKMIEDEAPDAILIAGDVYDRSIPSEEAMGMLDDFLVALYKKQVPVILISGNHDSAERVAYMNRLVKLTGIHMSPVYDGDIKPIMLSDAHGDLAVWPLPFVKPVHVRRYFEDAQIQDYSDAMKTVVEHLDINTEIRNVAIAHQFIVGASVCDSEELSVGGTDQVSAEVFEPFDYVALGHLHGPQHISRDTIRYAGSPLKYSFSEVSQKKSVTVIEFGAKEEVPVIRLLPLIPLRDMKKLSGEFADIIKDAMTLPKEQRLDYYEITLKDEQDIPNALGRLREVYPNIMTMQYDNTRTRNSRSVLGSMDVEQKSELELFDELYELQNGVSLSEEQRNYLTDLMEEIWR